MSAVEVTSLSSKGQVVIPTQIRTDLHLSSGDKFVILSDGKNILLKPVEAASIEDFKSLISRSRAITKSGKLKKSDLHKVIAEVRSEDRS
ncbi:MAG: AbrB/MazE/SpoVT family DNA-binding domain-containing protein [Desulfamplus sp.]|nr:AbrB/MazE/SpoVT family DNA-binding domain-containing protein [Desulfamplus sp.]